MMKFLCSDPRTKKAVEWKSHGQQVIADFFFHHRGTAAQKSFEGLVQSIISQIVEQEAKVLDLVLALFQEQYQKQLDAENLGSLLSDVAWLIRSTTLRHNLSAKDVQDILNCELPRKTFRQLVRQPLQNGDTDSDFWDQIERDLPHFQKTWIGHSFDSYPDHWNSSTRSKFDLLVSEWYDAMDLKARLQKLIKYGTPLQFGGGRDSVEEPRTLDYNIEKVVQRHKRRTNCRITLELEIWTLSRLSKIFTSVIDQQHFDLDLCLFLDALDEYDGRPEMIAEFLKDLVSAERRSQTRVRIVFSSRPWKVFMDIFSKDPGFRIHEHTEDDIQELCAQHIQPSIPGYDELKQLISTIAHKAQGVFLWVRLALHDLCAKAAKCVEAGERGRVIRQRLLSALEKIPHDLAEYYQEIIERIPKSIRRATYCLLEAVCRSGAPLSFGDFSVLLSASKVTTSAQLEEFKLKLKLGRSSPPPRSAMIDQIQEISGGLVELVGGGTQLQLLHQTVLEFVQRPDFKQIVLGSRANITDENGHTFLVQRFVCFSDRFVTDGDFLHHLLEAERTTGVSMFKVLQESRFRFSGQSLDDTAPIFVSVLGLAVAAKLDLLLRDVLDSDDNVAVTTKDPLLRLLIFGCKAGFYTKADAVSTIRLLHSHGFSPTRDPVGLEKVLVRHHRRLRFTGGGRSWWFDPATEFESLAIAALDGCNELEPNNIPAHTNNPLICNLSRMLHFSSLKLAQYLLDRGANPNVLDTKHRTPLDVIYFSLDVCNPNLGVALATEKAEICELLASRGGMFSHGRPQMLILPRSRAHPSSLRLSLRFFLPWERRLFLAADKELARQLQEDAAGSSQPLDSSVTLGALARSNNKRSAEDMAARHQDDTQEDESDSSSNNAHENGGVLLADEKD